VPIIAFSPEANTRRRMALIWGVMPAEIKDPHKIDTLASISRKALAGRKVGAQGRRHWHRGRHANGIRGTTNFMKFHVIGGET